MDTVLQDMVEVPLRGLYLSLEVERVLWVCVGFASAGPLVLNRNRAVAPAPLAPSV